ncbi:hypothetical protein D3C71_1742010 [compost metagenome]
MSRFFEQFTILLLAEHLFNLRWSQWLLIEEHRLVYAFFPKIGKGFIQVGIHTAASSFNGLPAGNLPALQRFGQGKLL